MKLFWITMFFLNGWGVNGFDFYSFWAKGLDSAGLANELVLIGLSDLFSSGLEVKLIGF